MRQRLQHARRRQQRAEILERDVHAGDLAQKPVDLVRGDIAHLAARGAILEQPASRQLPQQRDRGGKARRGDLLDGGLAALGAKRQGDALAVDGDVRLQQGGRAAGAAQARIAFGSRPDGAARHQLDHRGRGEFARRRIAGEMLGDAAADARQHVGEPRQAPRLANLAHLFPIGMIAVLQPAGGIAPDGLQVRGRVLRVEHVGVGGRHGETRQPLHRGAVADHAVVGIEIDPALAAPAPADRQGVGGDEPQAQPLRQGFGAARVTPAAPGRGALAVEDVGGCIGHGSGRFENAGQQCRETRIGSLPARARARGPFERPQPAVG